MDYFEIIKPIGMTATAGVIVFAANKFYAGAMLLINHDHQIKDLIKAVTIDIPKKMDAFKEDIIGAHASGIQMFASELHPIKDEVKTIKIDIFNLKTHPKLQSNG